MDRYAGEKDRSEAVNEKGGVRGAECGVKIIVSLLGVLIISLIYLCSDFSYAEVKEEGERRIELEKTEIIGVLERPAAIFPLRWKDPEGPDEKQYTLKRNFKREIFEFVDMDNINANIKYQKSK